MSLLPLFKYHCNFKNMYNNKYCKTKVQSEYADFIQETASDPDVSYLLN